jgi:hypothetical protein
VGSARISEFRIAHHFVDAFNCCESDVNNKFNELIQEEQIELDKLECRVHASVQTSAIQNLSRRKRCFDDVETGECSDENSWGPDTSEGDDDQSLSEETSSVSSNRNTDSGGNLSREDKDDNQSIKSSSSRSNNSGDEEDETSDKFMQGKQEVFELDDSNSESHSRKSFGPETCSITQHAENNLSSDDGASCHDAEAPSTDQNFTSDSENESDLDEDNFLAEMQEYHERNISRGQLTMAMQGFQKSREILTAKAWGTLSDRDLTVFDSTSVSHCGRVYYRNRCYKVKPRDGIVRTVAILRFVTENTARCILVSSFEDTFLGIEDEGFEVDSAMQKIRVQVYKHVQDLHLSTFESDPTDGQEIPDLIYDPRKRGTWHTFGYFYDRNKIFKKTRRKEMRTLELFAGAGGSMLGYCVEGFVTVLAVEKDPDAVMTLKANNPDIKVYNDCIRQFLKD